MLEIVQVCIARLRLRFAEHKTSLMVLVSQLIKLVGSLITFFALTRLLSTSYFGVYAILGSASVFIAILDFGIGNALRNRITKHNIEMKKTELSRTFVSACVFLLAISSFGALLLSYEPFSRPIVEDVLSIPWSEGGATAALCLIIILFVNTFSVSNRIINALKDYKVLVEVEIFRLVVCLGWLALVYVGGYSPSITLIGFFCCSAAAEFYGLLRIAQVRGLLRDLPAKNSVRMFYEDIRSFLRPGASFFVLQIMHALLFYSDSILAARQLSLESSGNLKILTSLYQIGVTLVNAFLSTAWTEATECYHEGNVSGLRRITWRGARATCAFTFAAVLSSPAVGPILTLLSGRSYALSASTLGVFAFWFFVNCFPYIYIIVLGGVGRTLEVTLLYGLQISIKFSLVPTFAAHYGEIGIVAASAVSLIPAAVAMPIVVERLVRKNVRSRINVVEG